MANNGKIVIVAALDATFKRTPFGDILKLVPIAESVVKLMAVCMSCFSDGSFTKRKTDETEVTLIIYCTCMCDKIENTVYLFFKIRLSFFFF